MCDRGDLHLECSCLRFISPIPCLLDSFSSLSPYRSSCHQLSSAFVTRQMASLQDIKTALKEPIADAAILCDHLKTIHQQIQSSSPSNSNFDKSIAAVQSLLLENVLPTWATIIDEDPETRNLLEGCFAPGEIKATEEKRQRHSSRKLVTAYAGYHTLSTALSNPKTSPHLLPLIIYLTSTLTSRYGLAQLWHHAFTESQDERRGKFVWEEGVKMVVALPGRVMNAYGRMREAGVRGVDETDVDRLNGRYVLCGRDG